MTWMQNVRDGRVTIRLWPRCLFKHQWQVYQHNVEANEDIRFVFVVAWKQCPHCGKSKLLHILE